MGLSNITPPINSYLTYGFTRGDKLIFISTDSTSARMVRLFFVQSFQQKRAAKAAPLNCIINEQLFAALLT